MKHEMIGYVDGDWIKFLCPHCDKQWWINQKTGVQKKFGGDFFTPHSGNLGPVNLKGVDAKAETEEKPEVKAWLVGRE